MPSSETPGNNIKPLNVDAHSEKASAIAASEKQAQHARDETMPEVSASKVMSVAESLGHDQHRWRHETSPVGLGDEPRACGTTCSLLKDASSFSCRQ